MRLSIKSNNRFDFELWMGMFLVSFKMLDGVSDRRELLPQRVLGQLEIMEAQEGQRYVEWV